MPEFSELPESVQQAVELMVSQIENTILTSMEETIIAIIPEHKQWAHSVAARIFTTLSTGGWSFSLGLGTVGEPQ